MIICFVFIGAGKSELFVFYILFFLPDFKIITQVFLSQLRSGNLIWLRQRVSEESISSCLVLESLNSMRGLPVRETEER